MIEPVSQKKKPVCVNFKFRYYLEQFSPDSREVMKGVFSNTTYYKTLRNDESDE